MSATSDDPTVLVVDDEPFNLSLMEGILNKDYTIQKASNGTVALGLAFANPPDLILVDVMMPGMDGFEVCRKLKANAARMHEFTSATESPACSPIPTCR